MEIFCKKEGTQNGKKSLTEYKLISNTLKLGTLGSVKSYGVSVKRFSKGNFEYCLYRDISEKPNTVIKLIKKMFDKGISPEQSKGFVDEFLQKSSKNIDNENLL